MLEASDKSTRIAEILNGYVTAPAPLKYVICGGSGQEELRFSVATSTAVRISDSAHGTHIS
jgi:hypothetical protein